MKTIETLLLDEVTKFTAYLIKLSQSDKEALMNGSKQISHELTGKPKSKEHEIKDDSINLTEVIDFLRGCSSRTDGMSYIQNLNYKRNDYERLIRQLDLPFNKKDNVDRMCEKIIEGTIGYRLRSQAIQNANY